MSCSSRPEARRPVLLGIRDAAIAGGSRCSWDTNKAGATPDCLPGVTLQYPDCTVCRNLLLHVVQVYCPLEGSPYHRTINVWACPRPECWGRSESWKVLRSQCRVTTQKMETRAKEDAVCVTARDWCDEADDWGLDDSSGISNEVSLSVGVAQPPHSRPERELRVQSARLQALSLLEEAEGDRMVPQAPVPAFQSFYISVMEEEDCSVGNGFNHEQELLREYQRREGVNIEQMAFSSCEDDGITEAYEKGKARHGDITFAKFMKRISSCPEQILRYCWNGSPLLLSSAILPIKSATPVCEMCGSARVFEFQLMPALVNMLKSESDVEMSVEFGTVLIYTCGRSCWDPNKQTPVEECAFVQGDPDQHFFR